MNKLLYNFYFYRFMKENRKDINDINWSKWEFLDKQCDKYYNLIK